MRTRQYSWIMKTTAWITVLTTGGFPLALAPARSQQIKERREAMTPKPVSALPPGLTQCLTPDQWKALEKARKVTKKQPDTQKLSTQEMKTLHGRGIFRNKYFGGALPWQRAFRDVNLSTGNLFKSFTDIQVAPARGAGLSLQRTYNSNDERVGPFGIGWTHAYDIRMEESQASVSDDPDIDLTDPHNGYDAAEVNFAARTDFFGHKHRYHRDADGLYTPPPYLYDEMSSAYVTEVANGPSVSHEDTDIAMDGTTKHFSVKDTSGVRVCDWIKDRYGNTTSLDYYPGTSRLQRVTDPSGRTLTFYWLQINPTPTSQDSGYRIVQVDGPMYSVVYDYYTDNSNPASLYNLKSVTLDASTPSTATTSVVPGAAPHVHRKTTYTYTSVTGVSAAGQNNTENGLLASIIDPIGNTVNYDYTIDPGLYGQAGFSGGDPYQVWCYRVTEPVGNATSTGQMTWRFEGGPGLVFVGPSDFPSRSQGGLVCVSDNLYRIHNMVNRPADGGAENPEYSYEYGSNNNVKSLKTFSRDTEPLGPQSAPHMEQYIYGSHGNVLEHHVLTEESPQKYTKDTTAYFDSSQYFSAASVTDPNLHTSFMVVGNRAGSNVPTGSDPIGSRGNVLEAHDAKYGSQKSFHYTYNLYGQKTSETDEKTTINNLNGVKTTYEYDAVGYLKKITQDPNLVPDDNKSHLNRVTTMTYDAAGHVLTTSDPNANASSNPQANTNTFTYNNLGQPLTAHFHATSTTPTETVQYEYGDNTMVPSNGRLLSTTDGRGKTVLHYEPGCDRISSVDDPITGTTQYTYGRYGERLTMTLPGGGVWHYEYNFDDTGRAAISCFALPKDEPNSYSPRLSAITDDQGRRVEFDCDMAGHLIRQRSNFVYDISTPTAPRVRSYQQTVYVYDGEDPNYTDGDGNYVLENKLTHFWLLKIATTWYSLDQYGQNAAPPKLLAQNLYEFYPNGNRKSNAITSRDVNDLLFTRTEQYAYDALDRLTHVDYGDNHTQDYDFDSLGNRNWVKNDATQENYTYNDANMLIQRGSQAYSDDINGNTLTDGQRTNTWDSQNRLIQCIMRNGQPTQQICQYTYGSDGIRRRSIIDGIPTEFALDNGMMIREFKHQGNNLTGTKYASATYFVGARGPEYRRDDTLTNPASTTSASVDDTKDQAVNVLRGRQGAVKWYVYDGLGSVVAEADWQGNLSSRRAYDVYGKVRGGIAASGSSSQKFVGSLGHTTDDETGLVCMRARYMDPQIGRFISEDPAREGNNWLTYCSNDCVNLTDASGRNVQVPDPGTGNIMKGLTSGCYSALTGIIAGFFFCLANQIVSGNGSMWGRVFGDTTVFLCIEAIVFIASFIGQYTGLATLGCWDTPVKAAKSFGVLSIVSAVVGAISGLGAHLGFQAGMILYYTFLVDHPEA